MLDKYFGPITLLLTGIALLLSSWTAYRQFLYVNEHLVARVVDFHINNDQSVTIDLAISNIGNRSALITKISTSSFLTFGAASTDLLGSTGLAVKPADSLPQVLESGEVQVFSVTGRLDTNLMFANSPLSDADDPNSKRTNEFRVQVESLNSLGELFNSPAGVIIFSITPRYISDVKYDRVPYDLFANKATQTAEFSHCVVDIGATPAPLVCPEWR